MAPSQHPQQPQRPQRPQVKPGLRQVWRDAGTLQIGLTPDTGVVVTGLSRLDAELLGRCDGTQRVSDLVRWAGRRGLDRDRVHVLLDLLDRAGVLTGPTGDRAHLQILGRVLGPVLGPHGLRELGPDAQAWAVVHAGAGDGYELLARRVSRRVLIVGRGRMAAAGALAVRRTGVTVERAETSRALLALLSQLGQGSAYALVVLVADDAVSTTVASALLAEGLPHLAVVSGADRIAVGPLVVPGRTACLRCLELARTDRDPGWPAVAAQLDAPAPAQRGEASLTTLAAGLLALQVAGWVDDRGAPASVGATLSVTLPDGLSVRRAWKRHPACGCQWLAGSIPPDLHAEPASGLRHWGHG
jgi:hypothetical protein